LLGDQTPGFVESFYDHLLSFGETRALIPDESTLNRLKKAQSTYFKALVAGVYDRPYLEDRLRVGLAHAKVGLSPGWYLGLTATTSLNCCRALPRVWGQHRPKS
jgi:hypothetical protein